MGLAVLQKDENVFRCHEDMSQVVWHSEVGASSAILRAGYNLDCLMLRYAGVDWRDPSFATCNAGCATHVPSPPPPPLLPVPMAAACKPVLAAK